MGSSFLMRWFRQNRGLAGALFFFTLLYLLYNTLHPRGFSTAVFVQNANESVALAFVAMAQTVPFAASSNAPRWRARASQNPPSALASSCVSTATR